MYKAVSTCFLSMKKSKILKEYFYISQLSIKLKQQSHIYKSLNDMSCFPCCSFIRATLSQSARIPPWTGWLSTCPRSGGNGPPTLSSPSCPTSDISNRGRIYRRWKTSSQDLHRSNIITVDSLLHSS